MRYRSRTRHTCTGPSVICSRHGAGTASPAETKDPSRGPHAGDLSEIRCLFAVHFCGPCLYSRPTSARCGLIWYWFMIPVSEQPTSVKSLGSFLKAEPRGKLSEGKRFQLKKKSVSVLYPWRQTPGHASASVSLQGSAGDCQRWAVTVPWPVDCLQQPNPWPCNELKHYFNKASFFPELQRSDVINPMHKFKGPLELNRPFSHTPVFGREPARNQDSLPGND